MRFDYAYITIHGTPGENGLLQGYFDLIGLPYSSCNVLVSALTFNKFACNQFLKGFGVRAAESVLLRAGQRVTPAEVAEKVGFPCFVKPNVGGSSFGVTKVKAPDQVQPAIDKAFAEGGEVLIEAFMPGTELTCGVFKTRAGGATVLPVTEVVTHNEFFRLRCQVQRPGGRNHPGPHLARPHPPRTDAYLGHLRHPGLPRPGARGLHRDRGRGHQPAGGEHHARHDGHQLHPQQVRAAGLTMTDVLTAIIEDGE